MIVSTKPFTGKNFPGSTQKAGRVQTPSAFALAFAKAIGMKEAPSNQTVLAAVFVGSDDATLPSSYTAF